MTTLFPQEIDSFPIRLPQEIIRAVHMNDVQEAIVKIEIFIKDLEQSLESHILDINSSHLASTIGLNPSVDGYLDVQAALQGLSSNINNHINNSSETHNATTISVNNISGVITTNLQLALENLKYQIDQIDLNDTDLVDFNAHLANDIASAHSGQLPGSRITSGTITNTQIADATITESKLSFSTVTPSQLTAHTSLNIADAHTGQLPITRLDTSVATTAQLNTHTSSFLNTHGVGLDSEIVGTKTEQILENKTIISDFEGSKIVLFTTPVDQTEKQLFNKSDLGSNQFEVRQKSTNTIISTDGILVTVANGNFFSDIIGTTNGIEFFNNITLTSLGEATVSNIDGNTLTLTSLNTLIEAGNIVVNKTKSTPLFSIDNIGSVDIKQLNVSAGIQNIELKDDVTIEGTLEVDGLTTLKQDVEIRGNTTTLGSFSTEGFSTNNAATNITSSNLSVSNNATFGDNVTIQGNATTSGDQLIQQDLHVSGNSVVDGYLNVGGSAGILGSLTIQDFLNVGDNTYIGGSANIVGHTTIQDDLEVFGDLSVRGGFITEGYSIVRDTLRVEGNLLVTGTISAEGSIDAYLVRFDINDTYNLALENPLTEKDLQLIPIEIQENLEQHATVSTNIHGADGEIVGTNNVQTLYNKTLQGPFCEGYLSTNSSNFDFINSNATTINAFGQATSLTLGTSTSTATYNIATGATTSSNTKTINIGTAGVSGSITNINLGSSSGGTVTVNKDLEIVGDLWVRGTTTTIDTTNTLVKDSSIRLNKGGTDSTAQSDGDGYGAGITIEGSLGTTLATLQYDSTLSSRFKIGTAGAASEIITSSTTQTITGAKTLTNSLTITPTSNQLVLGTTNTVTLSATAPSASRIYTIPDAGASADFILTEGSSTINGAKTLTNSLTITPTSNQLVLGTTNTVTLSATAPSTSRTYTIPEVGASADFILTEGSSTINGAKTFTGAVWINANSNTTPGLKITQQGSSSSLLVEDQSSDTTPFIVDKDGYVGIQTNSPTYELDVVGRARANFLLTNSEGVSISSNAISVSKGLVILTSGTQLSTINNLSNGQQLVLINNTGSVVLITNSGNIATGTGRDFRLANSAAALVHYSSTTGKAQLIGGGGTSDVWEVVTSAKTMEAGVKYFADTTSGGFSLTLPSSPQLGETIIVSDPTGQWSTNNLTLIPGSLTHKIDNNTAGTNYTIAFSSKTYTLTFYTPTNNWIILKGVTVYGG